MLDSDCLQGCSILLNLEIDLESFQTELQAFKVTRVPELNVSLNFYHRSFSSAVDESSLGWFCALYGFKETVGLDATTLDSLIKYFAIE